jgi:Raf kinase inhibitor-like YbhB/YbcL family protein
MKFIWIISAIVVVLAGWFIFVPKYFTNMPNLQIKSPVFSDNAKIPAKYTCDGENINPPLSISGVPSTAKSLVLILDDPDAPGGTFNHWVVWNMPATTGEIKEGGPVPGTQGINSGGENGYFGPCPPSGIHRYIFKLYALDNTLNLDSYSESSAVKQAMNGHIIEQAQIIGLYR